MLGLPSIGGDAGFSAPSASNATSGDATSRQDSAAGAGNRGYINNFAAAGANLTATQGDTPAINGPSFAPGNWTWMLPLGLLGGLILWGIMRRKG